MTERDILAAASAHADPAARSAFLDAACGGDTGLRSRVEELLHSAHTPDVGDGVTRTVAPVGEPGAGPTRTVAPGAGGADFAATRAPDDGAADVDLTKLLSPPQEVGSLGRLDHYEVLGVVGRGGMGVVLRAHDTKLRRVVALKLLAPALAAVGTARKRFAREAQAAAAVRDEHVVDIHAVCEGAAVPYLVMEFVAGATLEDRVRAEGPLDPAEAVRIAREAAAGLAAAHARGLIHRDVKPGNILLEGGTGRVKLTDFGLARAADDASISRSGVIAGTPLYMSPEQAKGDHIDHRSDLFSLGSVLYTLLTGKPAFRAESTVAVIRRVCKDTPRPIRESSPGVPRWVCAVVEKLMAKDPADRIPTAAEVADLLGRYLAHAADPDRVPPPPPIQGVRVAGGRWTRRRVAGLVAAVVVVALGVSGYRALRPAGEVAAPAPNPEPSAGEQPAGWRPPTAAELAARPSPLDGRAREQIPPGLLALAGGGDPKRVPPEVVAVLGDGRFRLPRTFQSGAHAEMRQDREGKWLAVPNGDAVVVFDARTGERVHTLTGRVDRPHAVGFSPDGKYLAGAATADDKQPYAIKLWELATGKEVTSLQSAGGTAWAVAFGPDGTQLFCAGNRGLDVWDVASEKVVRSFPGVGLDSQLIHSLALGPDGKTLVWGDSSAKVKVWVIGSGDPPAALDGHSAPPQAVAFAPAAPSAKPGGGTLLATGNNKELLLWDTAKWELVKKIDTPACWLAFDPAGTGLLTSACGAAPNKSGHVVTRWNLATFQGQPLPPLGPKSGHVQLSTDGKTLFFLDGDGRDAPRRVRVHDAVTGLPLPARGHTGEVWGVAVSPDGRSIASGGDDGSVLVWDLGAWAAGAPQPPVRVLTGHTGPVLSVAFGPDGKLLASAGRDGTVRLWEVPSAEPGGAADAGKPVRTLDRGKEPLTSNVAFTADGKLVAVGDEGGGVRLWDVATGEARPPLRWHGQAVSAVATSPDGRFLASAGRNDRKVHLTDLKTMRRVQTLGPPGDGKAEMRVAFAGDGRTLAYGGWDASVRVWDSTDKRETELTGGGANLSGLAVDPTGRFVAAARGATVRLWDRTAPTRAATVGPAPFDAARQVAFTPEGRYLVAAGANGTVSVIRVRPLLGPRSPDATRLDSAAAVNRLRAELEAGPLVPAALADADFARVPLTRADAATARALLADAHAARVRADRAAEWEARLIKDGNLEMPFAYQTFGEKPKDGWSLYVSLHGGGGTTKAANDQQWENQKKLYAVDEGIYLTPRAPTNTWNLWHDAHIDPMLARLIEDCVALAGANPNRVYLLGAGGGGDGVYQLAPRMADHWAAAAMLGGHPNRVSPLALRNVPLALHAGANDTAFGRNRAAREYGEALAALRADDPNGYEHVAKLHAGKGAGLGGEEKAALPWLARFARNPVPDRVVWKQTGVHPGETLPARAVFSPHHDRLYWLAVPAGEAKVDALVAATRTGQTVAITAAERVGKLLVRLDDRMLDLDRPVKVTYGGKDVFAGEPARTIGALARTLAGRGDPELMFDAEVEVDLAGAETNDAPTQTSLGVGLMKLRLYDEAAAHFHRAVELDPRYALAHDRLAVALANTGRPDEGLASARTAVELDPNLATAHNNLGAFHGKKGQWDEAVAGYRRAVELDPKFALAHTNLGFALLAKDRPDEALGWFRKATELDPRGATAHAGAGLALEHKGEYGSAAASYRRAIELDPQSAAAQGGLVRVQRVAAVEDKLPAFRTGDFKPTTLDERLGLFELCVRKKLYRAAAGLAADAPAADAGAFSRDAAARAAARAAAGQGDDAADLGNDERARLRKLALDWLRADLDAHAKRLAGARPADRVAVVEALHRWHHDDALAAVRGAALDKLPDGERTALAAFWAEAAALLKEAQGAGPASDPELRRIAALPAAEQVEAVRKELKKRNPEFDGELTPTIRDGAVTGLSLKTDLVADIAPLRALAQLKSLHLVATGPKRRLVDLSPLRGLALTELHSNGNPVVDISPLKGMPLQHLLLWGWRGTDMTPLKGMPLKVLNCGGGYQKLDLTHLAGLPLENLCVNFTQVTDLAPLKDMPLHTLMCANTPVADLSPLKGLPIRFLEVYKTKVADLSPLKGMPLATLHCEDSGVTDLSPLRDLPLKQLRCTFKPERDADALRAIRTLETINDKPAAEFWKSVEKK